MTKVQEHVRKALSASGYAGVEEVHDLVFRVAGYAYAEGKRTEEEPPDMFERVHSASNTYAEMTAFCKRIMALTEEMDLKALASQIESDLEELEEYRSSSNDRG